MSVTVELPFPKIFWYVIRDSYILVTVEPLFARFPGIMQGFKLLKKIKGPGPLEISRKKSSMRNQCSSIKHQCKQK